MQIPADIFVARRSPGRLLALLGLLLIMSIFLLLVEVDFSLRLKIMARVVGALGILTCLIAGLSKLRRPSVEIRVSAEGIYYRPWSDQTVPWDQVVRVTERRINVQKILCLHLKDPSAFRTKAFNRITTRMNKASGDFGDVNVMAAMTDRSLDELKSAVSAYVEIER